MGIHTSDFWFRLVLSIALLVILLALSLPVYSAGVSQSAMLANSCAACHGTDGKSPGSIPSISGKSAKFITETLKGFRDGTLKSTVMGRHAKGYSDEEIQLIAEFFSSVK